MKTILAVLFSLLLSLPAFANDTYLFTPLVSYHVDREMGDCEVNPGLSYQTFRSDRRFYNFGAFRNSKCNTAVMAFVGWETHEKKRLLGVPYGYGIMGGLTTGYDIPVMAAPFIRIGDRDARFNLNILTIPHPSKGVYGLGIRYNLGR